MSARTRGGFTLLEVVAALALHSALVVAVLPLLVEATKVSAEAGVSADADRGALREFADAVLTDDDRARFLARLRERGELSVQGTGLLEGAVVRVRMIASSGIRRLPHDWIEFRCGEGDDEACIVRYVPREDPAPESAVAGGTPQ